MAKINDLDLENWKEITDINLDSLWIINKRDSSGVHNPGYHGNFVPQIPNQLFRRYTKEKDFVLDAFCGGGTSLIEAQRLKRNSIGIELQEEVAKNSFELIKKERNTEVVTDIYVGNSANIDLKQILSRYNREKVQFVIYHPPYWDIIKFSEKKEDLSNAGSLDDFLKMMSDVVDNTSSVLEKGRYCAVVIGDKYSKGELVPLSFYMLNLFQSKGFKLKSIIVKNIDETKGKRNQHALWRYRALAGNFYLFKHEYIMIFRK